MTLDFYIRVVHCIFMFNLAVLIQYLIKTNFIITNYGN